jgi:3-methyladenine DNA glycosylase AlkD
MSFQKFVLAQIQRELPSLGNKKRAAGAEAYMKGIAPFLGVQTPERRALTMKILKEAGTPTSAELARTARALWKLEQREYQYVASDMIRKFIDVADKNFLADHIEFLLTQKSWWDTVDSLGTAAVSPLTIKFNSLALMKKWNKSPNMWLQRAAIQHQRGRKTDTDVALLLKFCDDHADDHEFFIAKAIGWALRDLAHHDRYSVTKFLKEHPDLDRVAVREALTHANK